ncbi:hypothetical protein [Mucilaginibacter gilvus]|uniref:Uncharacterized protein n=1 Tax=Mucilaginibacter gilvus TaxID=2305909 RepID=A0A3S3VIZ7_9SPHI|nr:hypothetical protein [Mucilaginibacter gilvus]RWY49296.1 hypothetical protein EPL05_17965 [Mucilaginibacter gilvus]
MQFALCFSLAFCFQNSCLSTKGGTFGPGFPLIRAQALGAGLVSAAIPTPQTITGACVRQ